VIVRLVSGALEDGRVPATSSHDINDCRLLPRRKYSATRERRGRPSDAGGCCGRLDAPLEFIRRSTRLVTRSRGLDDVVVLRRRRRVVGGRLVRRLVVRDPTGEGRMLCQGEQQRQSRLAITDPKEGVDGRMHTTLVIT